jgi:hypothetical protein
MTERERLHLVGQIGAIMDSAEPKQNNDQEEDYGRCIHIHSPDNRIAGRDFIEVNINLGENRDPKGMGRTNQDIANLAMGRPAEILQLLQSTAAEILFAAAQQNVRVPLARE